MRTLTILASLALAILITACNTDINSVPDVMRTGQLVVAYEAGQYVRLWEGECADEATDETVGEALDDVTGRLYYGLEPGAYCLEWGWWMGDDAILVGGFIPLDIVAGAVEFISVIQPALSPG